MALNTSQLEAISKQVYQKFPELKGSAPEVQSRAGVGAKALNENYLLIFKEKPQTSKAIVRVVRVTTDAQGTVLKISTSR